MARYPNEVFKYNHLGEVVMAYQTVKEACKSEGISSFRLYRAIDHGRSLNGHMFTFDENGAHPFSAEEQSTPKEQFDRNGFFDVDEFGQLYANGRWDDTPVMNPIKLKFARHG